MLRPLATLAALLLAGCSKGAPAAPAQSAAPAKAVAMVVPVVTGPLQVGMNFGGIANFTGEQPFLDRMKTTNTPNDGGKPYDKAKMDAEGWPIAMPADGGNIVYGLEVDPKPAEYVLLYDGAPAAFARNKGNGIGGTSIDFLKWGKGRVTFRARVSSIVISVDSLDPKAPLRNIRIVRADQEPLLAAGQVINPDFVNVIGRHFSPLRMMDWGCTNGSQLAHWADRPKTSDARWGCVPIEAMVAAANASHSDLWLNVPAHADDEYVRQLATLVHGSLAPDLKLHLEYSNEVWNDSFEQSKWAQVQGLAAFGPVGWERERFYGRRAAQVMAIARPILGDRLVGVLGTWDWRNDEVDNAIADGVTRAKLGALPSLFGEYAFAPYFGDAIGVSPGNEPDRPVTLRWAQSGAAGLDAAFAYLEHGTGLKSDTSLDYVRQGFPRHYAWAKTHGLAMITYEGGISVYNFGANPDEQKARVDFLERLVNDPRMGGLYARLLREFHAAGGKTFTNFNDVGGVSVWGAWGAIRNLASTSPRYQALRAASSR